MRFSCPQCGRRYASEEEPQSGRVYSIRCTCGKKLMVGAGKARPGPQDPFPPARRRVRGGPSLASLGPPPLADPRSPGLAALPKPAGPPAAGTTTPTFDAYAASHGLLIDEEHARALAAGSAILEPVVEEPASEEAEAIVTFSRVLPAAPPERAPEPPPARRAGRAPSAWMVPAAAVLAFLAAGGGAAWLLVPRAGGPWRMGFAQRDRATAPADLAIIPGAAAAALRRSAASFDACVRQAARDEPWLRVAGRSAGLQVTVAPSGRVANPRIDEADLDQSALGACIRNGARRMAFPPHAGGPIRVRLPLKLGEAE